MTESKLQIDQFGNKWWFNENRQLHRENGPAVEHSDGNKFWYINDKCHREDGPAREYADGRKSWWYQGEWITDKSQEEFERTINLLIFK